MHRSLITNHEDLFLYLGSLNERQLFPKKYKLENLLDDYLYIVWKHTDKFDKRLCNYDYSRFKTMVISHKRIRDLVEIRQIFCYLIVKYYPTVFSLKKIGDELGGRDHSTVIHAKNTVADLLLTDQHFRTLFKTIENKFINI